MKIRNLIIIIVLILLFSYLNANTQNFNCDDKLIKTNPFDSYNVEKTSKRNLNGVIFNWLEEEFSINHSAYSTSYIVSPFYQTSNSGVLHFTNMVEKENKPEDGWELIARNFNFDDTGVPIQSGQNQMYFILYNRYSGILRFFGLLNSSNQDYEYVQVKLLNIIEDDLMHTNTLDLASSDEMGQRPLNEITENTKFTAVARYWNDKYKWFTADFPMTYDPCVCLFKSQLNLEISLIDNMSIDLSGLIEGELVSINNKSGNVSDQSRKTIALGEVGTNLKKAVINYKSPNSFKNVLKENADEKFKDPENADMKKLAKDGIDFLSKAFEDYSFLKSGLEGIPYIGFAFGLLDFFTAGGKKSTQPQKVQLLPTSLEANISLSGSITNNSPFYEVTFWNPGSDHLNTTLNQHYPFYNRVLGVLNLLKKPKVVYRRKWSGCTSSCLGCTAFHCNYAFDYKLKENIEFVVNPASGLSVNADDIDIIASLQLEYPQIPDSYHPYTWLETPLIREDAKTFRTHYVPLECFKDVVASGEIWFIPDYMPHNVFVKLIINLKRTDSDDLTQNVLLSMKFPVELEMVSYHASTNHIFANSETIPWMNTPTNNIELSGSVQNSISTWGEIVIKSNTQFTNTSQIEIKSFQNIKVEQDVTIPPNVKLVVGYPVECSKPKQGSVDWPTLYSFCTSNQPGNYRPSDRLAFPGGSDIDEELEEQESIGFYVTDFLEPIPNPFSGVCELAFTLEKSQSVSISIRNSLGQTVGEVISAQTYKAGKHTINYSGNNLPQGVYFCTMSTPTFTKTVKLVKMN